MVGLNTIPVGKNMDWISSPWVINIFSGLAVSALLFFVGYLYGKYRERKKYWGKNLEEYDFYPFNLDSSNRPFFDLKDFRLGIYYFLKHRDYLAARQLILLGEQNHVRDRLEGEDLREYVRLYSRYSGDTIFDDTDKYLENYKKVVQLIGESIPDTGIEILLHNLSNPARSLIHIENNITGRKVGDGTTNLVLDLKMRKLQNQDKLNYELNIGSRKFKCTTIPIFRDEYGLIGAICINIDVNYITDRILPSMENVSQFFEQLCKVDMRLDENILSKLEYENALAGKRHWRDYDFRKNPAAKGKNPDDS